MSWPKLNRSQLVVLVVLFGITLALVGGRLFRSPVLVALGVGLVLAGVVLTRVARRRRRRPR